MTGWRSLPEKDRRAVRRRNHIARDLLGSDKYRQRVIPDKKKNKRFEEEDEEDYED